MGNAFIRIVGQAADQSGSTVAVPYFQVLKKCTEDHVVGTYSASIGKFGLVFRIDSATHSWGAPGPSEPDTSNAGFLTIECNVPTSHWLDQPHEIVRDNLLSMAEDCFERLVEFSRGHGLCDDVAVANLRSDWQRARECYLASTKDRPTLKLRLPSGRDVAL